MDRPSRDYRVLQQIRYGQYRLAKLTGDLCLRSPQNLLQSFRGPRGGGVSRANLIILYAYIPPLCVMAHGLMPRVIRTQ